jgi:hypothetical protein
MPARHTGRFCKEHPATELVCPRCLGKRGGKALAKSHSSAYFSKLGKLGGRPRKPKPKKPRKPKKRQASKKRAARK